ncbi:unnamed protein product [Bursaphelenchus xylophilus]|uniref:(pine wood nematode) hypothetical protein n=1 Tax=Bursaphelenchus xylophilus TaxID=6326 RepID=A0A1I7RYV3_BURXY|nr:unnamed protein product [Bursaphelenchus xylophilus]CAG9092174.1 unnamed protein product [Bursaphelenchus xylophilus]
MYNYTSVLLLLTLYKSPLYTARRQLAQGNFSRSLGVEKLVDEQRIIEKLLAYDNGNGYDWRLRPKGSLTPGADAPVDIVVNMYLRSISKVDDVNMEFALHFTFREEWVDERLLFFSPHHKHIVLSGDQHQRRNTKVWTPDTFFQNEKNGKKHTVDLPNVMIRIHNATAKVLYSCRMTLTLSCPMKLAAYPLDVQTCFIDYASYAYTAQEIMYRWKLDDPIQIKHGLHQSLPSFTLSEVRVGNCTSVTTTGTYSCLRTILKLKREFSYYLLQLYIPSFMLVLVSTISFWLNEESVAARITLGVTVLLTVTTMASGVNANLPPVSYTKSVDIWIGVCTGFIFGALLEFALVNWALHKDIKYKNRLRKQATSLLDMHTRHMVRPDTNSDNPQEADTARSFIGMFQWYQLMKRIRHKEKSQKIDIVARVAFPVAFLLFNLIYWAYYLTPYLAVRSTTRVSSAKDL